jgi:hypothetical protein
MTAATVAGVGIPVSAWRPASAALVSAPMTFVAACNRAASGELTAAVDAVLGGGLSEWSKRTMVSVTATKTTNRLARTTFVVKARVRWCCWWCAPAAECTGGGGRVVELACSHRASGHDVDADARSQSGIGGGTTSAVGSARTANFGVTGCSAAHTGVGGSAASGLCVGAADVGLRAGRRAAGVGRAAVDFGAAGLAVRAAAADFLAGWRAIVEGFAPSVSGASVLVSLRLFRVGSEALSSLSGVVVSAVGMPQYGATHTRWKVPRPTPLWGWKVPRAILVAGVRRREFGAPAREC